jgi:septal ring factor EnvC (AmiA/AmiB activator)
MKKLFLIISSIIVFTLNAEDSVDQQIKQNRDALEEIKTQISSLKDELSKMNIITSSTEIQITNIEREEKLLSKAKQLLEKEKRLLTTKITATQNELEQTQNELDSMKSRHADRIRKVYKKGQLKNFDLILSSNSLNQAFLRYKYFRLFVDQEIRLVNRIKSKIERIEYLKQELNLALEKQERSIQEKMIEQQKYLAVKAEKQKWVAKLRSDSANLKSRLAAKESEKQQLLQIIVALDRQRNIRERKGIKDYTYTLEFDDFSKNKGKLPWPVKGKIIHQYGRQKDRILKTVVDNTGIDIKAESGQEVRAIFMGVVSMITYLSGFGNTIILDHGKGYYTVYSHLDDVFVDKDDLVETNKIIGLVGDSGSLEGSKLHFAVFANQRTENPKIWLR